MIFQGLSVAINCLRPEAALLTILAIKRRLLCNFTKTFKGRHFMGHSGAGWKFFKLLLNSKLPKLSLHIILKNISKILILDLKERGSFFEFSFMFKVSQGFTS